MSVNLLCVFASGGGSHLKCIHKATLENKLSAKIALVVSNKLNCGAVEYAKQQKIPTFIVKNIQLNTDQLLQELHKYKVTDIVLAGFIKKIPYRLIHNYPDKIINIHPSLLPKYGGKGMYGLNVHRAVLENHETHTGCTIHRVNEFYDEGDILAQHQVEIPADIKTPEELSDFLKPIENKFYVEYLKQHLK